MCAERRREASDPRRAAAAARAEGGARRGEMPPGKTEYLVLESGEGHKFYVDKACACEVSGTIRSAWNTGYQERARGAMKFPTISTQVLEKVIQYMYYKVRYTNSTQPIPVSRPRRRCARALSLTAKLLLCSALACVRSPGRSSSSSLRSAQTCFSRRTFSICEERTAAGRVPAFRAVPAVPGSCICTASFSTQQ